MEFLEPRQFVDFLKKHDIQISERELERFEQEGLLQPILRLNIPLAWQKSGGLHLGSEGLKLDYKRGLTEFPKKGDYQPWSKFKANYTKNRELTDKRLIFYHPFQLLQIQNIIYLQKFCFMYSDSYTNNDIQRILSNIKKNKKLRKQLFHTAPIGQIDKIGFLMLLEEPYRFQAFGSMNTSWGFRKSDGFKAWIKWRRTKFSPQRLLQESGLSENDVHKLYDYFATKGIHLDPLEKWYDLTRIMRHSVLKKLKGDALVAQFYYDISRMIALFLYDLTKTRVEEPDLIFDGSKGEWKKSFYSDPFDYGTRKTQRGIIRYFVRDITTRIFFLVEGETEEKIVKEICKKLDVNLQDDAINLINYEGIPNLTIRKLKQTIQTSNKDHVSMFILADNECNAIQKIKKIKESIVSEFDSYVWNESFESDNFGIKKMFKLVNSYLQKYGEGLSKKEVIKYQKRGKPLMKAIESAYGKKYNGDIYRKIPKKSDLSLILMKPRLKRISRSKKTGTPLPIENVLERVFKMVPYWG